MGKKLFLFAAAAVALASCTETDLSGDTSFAKESTSDAIQFSAKAGNAGTTRAGKEGTITTASLKTGAHKDAGFGVMGYQTTVDLTIPLSTGQKPNFMFNQQVKWADGSGVWTYSPVKYWPNGIDKANTANKPSNTAISTNTDRLSFFAYAPWVDVASSDYTSTKIISPLKFGDDATGKNAFYADGCSNAAITPGIAAITANTLEADPQVFYYMPKADVKQAVDLLWGLRGSIKYKETDAEDNSVAALGDSYNVNLTKQDVPETVNFLFKHALAKIGGNTSSLTATSGKQQCGLYVVLDVDGNGSGMNGIDNQNLYLKDGFDKNKTLVTIEEVNVEDGLSADSKTTASTTSNLKNSGWFDIATGTWNNVGIIKADGTTTGATGATYDIDANVSTAAYKLNKDIAEGTVTNSTGADWQATNSTAQGYTGGATGVVPTEAKPVYADTYEDGVTKANDVPALLMIPTTDPQTLYVTVKYKVRTADSKLSNGFTEVTQTVTNEVSLSSLETNKYYKLVMHLGLTSVKFSAIVADWASTDDATYDESGTIDKDELAAEEVWLPSNVINAQTSTESAPGTSSNVNTQANTTEYTITLSGLVKDQKILAEESAANITAVQIGSSPITTEYTLLNTDVTAEGKAEIKVTLTPNTKVSAVSNLITITQKNNAGTVLTTTTVNIVQSAFDIVLTQNNGEVTVKDADGGNADLSDAKYTVKVLDSEGVVLTKDTHYTVSGSKITMSSDGTYTVIVTYTDGGSVTKTIKTTKVTPAP